MDKGKQSFSSFTGSSAVFPALFLPLTFPCSLPPHVYFHTLPLRNLPLPLHCRTHTHAHTYTQTSYQRVFHSEVEHSLGIFFQLVDKIFILWVLWFLVGQYFHTLQIQGMKWSVNVVKCDHIIQACRQLDLYSGFLM